LWEQEKYPHKVREDDTETETEGIVPSSPSDSMLDPLFLPAPSPHTRQQGHSSNTSFKVCLFCKARQVFIIDILGST
jgi:hypothetical protein